MKISELLTIMKHYTSTNTRALKNARKGGHAKEVAIDFLKFCNKNNYECHAYEGTFRLDKKQQDGKKEVKHYWNVIGDGMVFDSGHGTYKKENPEFNKKHFMIVDFAANHDFVNTGLAEDAYRSRYKITKEIFDE